MLPRLAELDGQTSHKTIVKKTLSASFGTTRRNPGPACAPRYYYCSINSWIMHGNFAQRGEFHAKLVNSNIHQSLLPKPWVTATAQVIWSIQSGVDAAPGRKSVEPLRRTHPPACSAKHQSCITCGAVGVSDKRVLSVYRDGHAPSWAKRIFYWIVDYTGFKPKKRSPFGGSAPSIAAVGASSDNCQVGGESAFSTERGSVPIDWAAVLCRKWCKDRGGKKSVCQGAEVSN